MRRGRVTVDGGEPCRHAARRAGRHDTLLATARRRAVAGSGQSAGGAADSGERPDGPQTMQTTSKRRAQQVKAKRKLLVGTSVTAVAVMASATAFACTVFKGTLTLTGNASTASVTATGTGTGMTETLSAGVAKATKTAGSVKLSTGADRYGRKLPARSYFVFYYNSTATAPGYTDHYHWTTDCMTGGPGVKKTTVSIGSDGRIAGQPLTVALGDSARADTGGQESAVCVSDSGAAYGLQAPVTIVL